jgi:phospholipid/cholesterol/gamma-HCH transport system ATP-binding protein
MTQKNGHDDVKIEIKDLNKSFGPKKVLNGVNLQIKKGESHVIIGGSGTGKSVLLKCVLGLIQADRGKIIVDNQDIVKIIGSSEHDKILERFGMLFQGGALFDSLPVWKNVSFQLIQMGSVTEKQAKELAIEKLQLVGMAPESAFLMPAELSGGMQKRVGLARAIAFNPDVIFFDEPTTGLDPIMSDVIDNLIVKCVKSLGATAISITHDMKSAYKIADRISMIYGGKIIWTGTPAEIQKSGNEYVDQFIHGRAEGPITSGLLRA